MLVCYPRPKNIKVLPSNGCTDNNVEVWASNNIKQNESYNPLIFRSIDRDGYTNEQVNNIEDELLKKNGKRLGIKNYQIKFLPVNELENFAVLADDYFTASIVSKNRSHLDDVFLQTAEENIRQNSSKFNPDLFPIKKISKTTNKMIKAAETDLLKFFPGKEIKKLKHNLDVKKFLISLKATEFPKELIKYLSVVKLFFEQNSLS